MMRLPPALERHISTRIATATTAVLHGNFTNEAAKSVPFALRIIAKQPSLRAPGNTVLAKDRLPIRMTHGCIDILVQELKTNPI